MFPGQGSARRHQGRLSVALDLRLARDTGKCLVSNPRIDPASFCVAESASNDATANVYEFGDFSLGSAGFRAAFKALCQFSYISLLTQPVVAWLT
jgi:hypothetical protein